MKENADKNTQLCLESILSIDEMGYYMPETILTSQFLQSQIDGLPNISQFNIEEKTGIVERRVESEEISITDMAEKAARDVIAKLANKNGFNCQKLDTIIYGGISRDYLEPSIASLIQKRLGIPAAISFDINNACLGFLDGMMVVDALVKSGMSKNALIIAAEKSSITAKLSLEAMQNGTRGDECIATTTVGDGAVAAIASARNVDARFQIVAFSRLTLGEFAECSFLADKYTPMETNSKGIVSGALDNCPIRIHDMLAHLNWNIEDLKALVIHQISVSVINRIADALGVPREKCPRTCDKYGNMASVSAPFTLIKALNEQKYKKGDKIILCGIAAGMSFFIMALEVK